MKMYRPHRLCPRNSKPKEPSLYRSLCVSILCMFLSTVMLVGTTFAWFHSSATSAVSTITAGGLDVSTSYITQSTVRRYADTNSNSTTEIPSTAWIPFDGNGGNPFGSIPFHSNDPQVIFLKLTNNSSNSPATYRLALNLLGDTSVSANSGNAEKSLSSLLRYGCNVLGSVGANSTELSLLSTAAIPGASTSDDGKTTYGADVTPESSETPPPVEISNSFVDALSSHGSTETESSNGKVTRITYGGHICKVDLSAGETQYVAVSLYMPYGSSYSDSSALVYIQLAMTVNQLNSTAPQMPNIIQLDPNLDFITQSRLNEIFKAANEQNSDQEDPQQEQQGQPEEAQNQPQQQQQDQPEEEQDQPQQDQPQQGQPEEEQEQQQGQSEDEQNQQQQQEPSNSSPSAESLS